MNKGSLLRTSSLAAASRIELREAGLLWARLMGYPAALPGAGRRGTGGLFEAYEEDYLDESSPQPRAIPSADPVPFAPDPPPGSFWPIVTSHARSREVNYEAQDGSFVGGNRGRRFLADRSSGARYHVGIDLFGNAGDPVVAITEGRIVSFYPFCCGDNKTSWALFVDHDSVVVNYGEVAPDSLTRNNLTVGSRVRAGDVIGYVGVNPGGSSMIHFETYAPGTRTNVPWRRSNARPAALRNPTSLLLWLLDNGRTPRVGAPGSGASGGSTARPDGTPSVTPATPAPAPTGQAVPANIDWTARTQNDRLRYVVNLLVSRYNYPLNAAAGIVGNLLAESGVLPSRLEGSTATTPLRAQNFARVQTDFTPEQVMNRNVDAQEGPRLPGVGLAQWTSRDRRAGLFRHTYQSQTLGAAILFDMDAQVDYLVAELAANYRGVDRVLRDASVSLNAASDEVVYNFEVPGAVLSTTRPVRKLPRTDAAVIAVFERRREYSGRALAAANTAASTRTEAWSAAENWSEELDEAAFKQAVLDEQIRNALAAGRTRYAPVPDADLAIVEGRHRLRTEAAAQCRALLSAARAALADAQRSGADADAARVTQIGIVSSYRDPAYDGRLWHQYYPNYYRATQAERAELAGGRHGDAAVRRLARYISQRKAAPGFSNHSDGRAIDFSTTEGGVEFGANTAQRTGWRRTWLHRWLVPNAERYGFHPLTTEEWHWDYRMGSTPR